MSGGVFIQPKKLILSVAASAATSQTAAQNLGLGDCYAVGLEVTAASGTSPTLDVVAQTTLDGTNWKDLPIRWTQKTAAGAALPEWIIFRNGLGQNEVALGQTTADTGGQLAKNCIFDPNNIRFKYTIGGTNPSFTFQFNIFVLPVQRVA